MVLSLLLLIIDVINLIICLDLCLVNKFKFHLYKPFIRFLPFNRQKLYNIYSNSLKREYFCVADKVDVSGTTFAMVFIIINTIMIILNLFVLDFIG